MTDSIKARGFTLIELMIVAAIVAILAGVAYPSYVESVRRGARAEARAAMLNMAQIQERNFTDRGTYVAVTTSSGAPWSSVNWSGTNQANRKYDITVASASSSVYTITATPVSPFSDPTCGNLTLTNDGTRGSTGDVTNCWK